MKKFLLLFSLMISSLAFAQWDGDFPGDGSWPSDSIIIVDGDTIIISNPGGGNPWGDDCICPMIFEPVCGDDGITYPNSCLAECAGVEYTLGMCDGEWDGGDWPGDGGFPWGDSTNVITDSLIVIDGDTIFCVSCGDDFPGWGDGDWPWGDDSTDVDDPWTTDMIVGCDGEEGPESWIGDGYCDDGSWGVNFNCEEFDFDGGDCEDEWDGGDWPGDGGFPWDDSTNVITDSLIVIDGDTIFCVSCGDDSPGWDDGDWPWGDDSTDVDDPWTTDMIVGCDGEEGPESWIGDGYCDDGSWGVNFNCEEFDFDGGDCEDEWDGGDWPGDGGFPWDDSTNVITDSLIVIDGDTIFCVSCGDDSPGWDDGDWPWGDDSTDVDDPWTTDMIVGCDGEEGPESWIGDGYCDDGSWGVNFNCEEFDFDGGDCEDVWDGGDWPGDDDECPWDEDGFDEGEFEELFSVISDMDIAEDEVVFILESTDVVFTILDEAGVEYTPTEVEGYLVFGPFSLEELYTIIIEAVDDFEIGWGLFRPIVGEIVGEGVITTTEGTVGGIFELSSMLSIDDVDELIEIYHTQYFDVMGREVINPENGIFIKVQHTNVGLVSDKVYIKN